MGYFACIFISVKSFVIIVWAVALCLGNCLLGAFLDCLKAALLAKTVGGGRVVQL